MDTKTTSWALLKRFKDLPSVFDASPQDLQATMGVGPAAASAIKIVKAAAAAYLKARLASFDALESPAAVVDYCRIAFAGNHDESLHALLVDSRNRVKRVDKLSDGTVDQASAHPRRVVETALETKSTGVILVHNHPSGALEPSADDERFTAEVGAALKTVGIRLIDHLIVSREGSLSFRERGRLPAK